MPEDFNITPAEFRLLPPKMRDEVLNGLSTADRALMRILVRVNALKDADEKLHAWVLAHPKNHPGRQGRLKRRAEYAVSLDNLAKYRQENAPTGNPISVDIGVPHVFTGRRA